MAADRPDWLVGWTAASLDEDLLPLWQLSPYGPPWPLNLRLPVARAACRTPRPLPRDRSYGSEQDGSLVVCPGCGTLTGRGAGWVRTALEEALRARFGRCGSVQLSLDLSGGIDSTSLCYLADRLGIPFSTVHLAFSDPSNRTADGRSAPGPTLMSRTTRRSRPVRCRATSLTRLPRRPRSPWKARRPSCCAASSNI